MSGNDERPKRGNLLIDNMLGIDEDTKNTLYELRELFLCTSAYNLVYTLNLMRDDLKSRDMSKISRALVVLPVLREVFSVRDIPYPSYFE
jgi:hypothetical protein